MFDSMRRLPMSSKPALSNRSRSVGATSQKYSSRYGSVVRSGAKTHGFERILPNPGEAGSSSKSSLRTARSSVESVAIVASQRRSGIQCQC